MSMIAFLFMFFSLTFQSPDDVRVENGYFVDKGGETLMLVPAEWDEDEN